MSVFSPRARRARRSTDPAPTHTVTVGLRGRWRARLQSRDALIAFGPPTSGKTSAIAVPALLEWNGPAIATSVKTDLVQITRANRERAGDVLIFDPFGLSGQPTNTWSPLRGARTWDGALEVAWRLAAAGELDQRGTDGGDFWAIVAEQYLAPLLFTAARRNTGISQVVAWAYGQDLATLHADIAAHLDNATGAQDARDARAAADALAFFAEQPTRTRTAVEGTAHALLRAYRFTRVAKSAGGCDITPERLLDGNSTLYLVGDPKASKLLRPIFLALLAEMIDAAYERANLHGGKLQTPLLLCLDDAGDVAPLPNLAEIAATASSHNIQLLSIFRDLGELKARYRASAQTVANAHRGRVLLPNVTDLDTLSYFAAYADGTLTGSQALYVSGRATPTRITLRRWFTNRALRRAATPQQITV